jgi:hypothetical protein
MVGAKVDDFAFGEILVIAKTGCCLVHANLLGRTAASKPIGPPESIHYVGRYVDDRAVVASKQAAAIARTIMVNQRLKSSNASLRLLMIFV